MWELSFWEVLLPLSVAFILAYHVLYCLCLSSSTWLIITSIVEHNIFLKLCPSRSVIFPHLSYITENCISLKCLLKNSYALISFNKDKIVAYNYFKIDFKFWKSWKLPESCKREHNECPSGPFIPFSSDVNILHNHGVFVQTKK